MSTAKKIVMGAAGPSRGARVPLGGSVVHVMTSVGAI
jgi:hypothetical protein